MISLRGGIEKIHSEKEATRRRNGVVFKEAADVLWEFSAAAVSGWMERALNDPNGSKDSNGTETNWSQGLKALACYAVMFRLSSGAMRATPRTLQQRNRINKDENKLVSLPP